MTAIPENNPCWHLPVRPREICNLLDSSCGVHNLNRFRINWDFGLEVGIDGIQRINKYCILRQLCSPQPHQVAVDPFKLHKGH